MDRLTRYEASGELESGDQVRLAQALEVMQIVHDTKDAVTEVAKKLAEHMEKEELDRRSFVTQIHEIQLSIQSIDQKIEVIHEELQCDLERNKAEVRKNIMSEIEGNITSLKKEVRDGMKEIKEDLKGIHEEISNLKIGLSRNSEWIDLGKRVAYTIVGALALGVLVLMGLNIK